MFNKQTRKKYLEQDWLRIKEDGDNPSQRVKRLRDKVNTSMNDLAIVAKRLPDEEQEIIFDVSKLKELLESLMTFERNQHAEPIRRLKNYKIAMVLIKSGLVEVKEIYEKLYKNSPYISSMVSDTLSNTIKICEDLTLGVIRTELEYKGLKDNLIYLFSHENLDFYDNVAFENFVINSIDKDDLEKVAHFAAYVRVETQGTSYSSDVDYLYRATLVDYLSRRNIGEARLEFNIRDLTCTLIIDLFDFKVIPRDLIVKKVDNDFVFYAKIK